jgi:hypothetical protein
MSMAFFEEWSQKLASLFFVSLDRAAFAMHKLKETATRRRS